MDDVAEMVEPSTGLQSGGSWLVRHGATGWDATAVVTAGLLLVLFLPSLMFESWTPRLVLLLLIGPLGVALLVGQARRREAAAVVLVAALAWTVVTGAVGPSPRSALLGFVGRDLSALAVTLAAGLWALGRAIGPRGRTWLSWTVAWGAAVNGLIAVLQVSVGVETGPLRLALGRATGLLTNPVYLGAVCAAGAVLCVAMAGTHAIRLWAPPLVLCGVGVSLSGSRVALIAVLPVVAALIATRRDRVTALASGLAAASLLVGVLVDRVFGAGRNAADRLTDGAGGGRSQVWRYGLEAFLDRPVFGHGFGRFRPAVQDHFSAAFVRDHAPDEVAQAWFDAHNVGVGVLVAVGVVGALLFVGWVLLAVRGASGPLLWCVVPIAVHWLLQPVSLFTLPLAMLALGAAASSTGSSRQLPRGVVAIAVAVGTLLGSTVLAADVTMKRAADRLDADLAARVGDFTQGDPIVADLVAQMYRLKENQSEPSAEEIEWRQRAAGTEPDRPYWWSSLALRYMAAGRSAEAEEALARAEALQQYNTRTLRAQMVLAVDLGDRDRLVELLQRSCELGMTECGLDAAELLAQSQPPGSD